VYIAEHNSVFELLKNGKLSEKPYVGGKSDIWQDCVQPTHSLAMNVHRLYVTVLGYLTSELTSSLLIYHNYIYI